MTYIKTIKFKSGAGSITLTLDADLSALAPIEHIFLGQLIDIVHCLETQGVKAAYPKCS
jgi:hypothetical protein